ncbi:MAG: ribonuclease E/G [Lachnospiraceae bacterium]|nr:ribonuclease E/G [Lachnospiraceae bacterium]
MFEFLLDDDRNPLEIHTAIDESGVKVGDIYSGKVEKILKANDSCFVNIGNGQKVFLKFKPNDPILYSHKFSKKDGLHENDEVVLQIKNAGIKTKNPTATSHFTLETKSMILSFGEKGIHVSKSINNSLREEIVNFLKNIDLDIERKDVLSQVCIIVRSNASDASFDELKDEFIDLLDRFLDFKTKASHSNPFALLKEAPAHYIERIIHAKEKIEKVITDDRKVYDELVSYSNDIDAEILFYKDEFELKKLFSLNQKLDNAMNRYVYLKSGANVTFDSFEAMNVIDVNSASSSRISSKSKDEYFFKINKECAIEIAKQIRLRNLSGIIIIDFINMKKSSRLDDIMDVLRVEFRKDPLKVEVVDKTALGLIEITREKKYPSLKQLLFS